VPGAQRHPPEHKRCQAHSGIPLSTSHRCQVHSSTLRSRSHRCPGAPSAYRTRGVSSRDCRIRRERGV
ncbi:hypothetical protein NDU88_000932, partial [Pleurodeles waltl]